MLIGDKYKIESDSLNVIVFARGKSEKVTTPWRAIAFFASPKDALRHLVTLEVMETGMKDLATIVKKLDELYTLIDRLKGLPELLPKRVESRRRRQKVLV